MEDIKLDLQKPKPFLRWAGGKRWLKKEIDKIVDINKFENYHEPFVGGGAILFHLSPKKSFVSDSNKELIDTYNAIKEDPRQIEMYIREFAKDKESYYLIRRESYSNKYQTAAQFIFLNQMSFNGIYRVNANGEYNVPYGNRMHYNFDFQNLYSVSKYLLNADICHCDFEKSLLKIKKGDLIFLDPPYTIAHNENGFIQYNQKIFSLEDQYRLSNMIDEIKTIKAFYILTNAAHLKVKEIFDKQDKLIEVSRASVVGGKNSNRGSYSEYLFTNL